MGGKHKPVADMAPDEQDAHRAYHRKKSMESYHRNRDKALARHKAWRAKNQEAVKAKQRAYHKKRRDTDPEFKAKNKARAAAWYQANKDTYLVKARVSRLKCLYGVDAKRFDAMMREQDGKCAICRSEPNSWHGRLVVDHCHSTGVVRGLLCDKCNVGLSRLGDGNIEVLRAAILYVEQSQTQERKSA